MSLANKLNQQFPDIASFAGALSSGIQDELAPVYGRMAALEQAIVSLGGQVSAATNAANAAKKAAEDAAKTNTPPTPTPSATPQNSSGSNTGGSSTPSPSPSPAAPAPTPSVSPRQTIMVIALPNPIFVGDILAGNTRQTATLGVLPLEGAFYLGSQMELSVQNVDSTVEFVNWTDAAGNVISSSSTTTTTITPQSNAITANFRTKTTTTGGTSTGGTSTGGSTGGGASGGGGSLGDQTGGSIEEQNRI